MNSEEQFTMRARLHLLTREEEFTRWWLVREDFPRSIFFFVLTTTVVISDVVHVNYV